MRNEKREKMRKELKELEDLRALKKIMQKENVENVFLSNASTDSHAISDDFADSMLDKYKISKDELQKLDALEKLTLAAPESRRAKARQTQKRARKAPPKRRSATRAKARSSRKKRR